MQTIPVILVVCSVSGLFAGNPDTETARGLRCNGSSGSFRVLINEIMADPNPPVGLPNAEYLELYNNSTGNIQLENYSLTVGTRSTLLPAHLLMAGSYVLLVDEDDVALFSGIPNLLPCDLPALTNNGAVVELADDYGITVHEISYDLDSYQDPGRDDGGWSLELINPDAPCALTGNLHVSNDLSGGTPGTVNSVYHPVPDTVGPALLRLEVPGTGNVDCVFNEILSGSRFEVSFVPEQVITNLHAEGNILHITLQAPLLTGTTYLLVVDTIADCQNNIRTRQQLSFGIAEPPHPGDILVNEILFDPLTGGSRFLELINTSDKFLNLSDLVIADIRGDTIAAYPQEETFLLHPAAIVAITPDVKDIRSQYPAHDPDQLISGVLPAFDRRAGNVTVYTRSGTVLDSFDYNAHYHNPLLDETKGVSLERLSTTANTQSPDNWQSAAASIGSATPGLPNSQRVPISEQQGVVIVEPEVFSPDADGIDDFLVIRFVQPPPGTLATIRVFDAQGREIRRLADHLSIAEGSLTTWDGDDGHGRRARIGPYVIWIQLLRTDGRVTYHKESCVVAERL